MKNKKGITLIALIITIIVLLILAGVALNAISGENGIMSNAKKAKTETEKAALVEEIKQPTVEYTVKFYDEDGTTLIKKCVTK